MRLCTIQRDGKAVVGVKQGDKIIDLSKQMPRGPKSVVEILAGGKKVMDVVAKACAKPKAGAVVSAKSAKYLPPIPTPGKILCIGLNYRKHAEEALVIFKEHGATRCVECWADDVPDGKVTSFPMAVKRKDDEAVVFSWVEWPSKEARDAGMKKVMEDPRMPQDMSAMPFDGQRMIYGGFQPIVDL